MCLILYCVAQTKGDILGDFDHSHPCGGGG